MLLSLPFLTLFSLAASLTGASAAAVNTKRDGLPTVQDVLPGTFVRAESFGQCPSLLRRAVPTNVADVRQDDFTVMMAMGDSVSAAFFAKSTKISEITEYRGSSFTLGKDPGAVSLANLFDRYTPNVGGSTGTHGMTLCLVEGICINGYKWGDQDGLNAAISGGLAGNMPYEAEKILVPRYKALAKPDGWAFLNVMIGPNDMCRYCELSKIGLGAASDYAKGVKEAVEIVRKAVPKLVVNIVGNLRVSDIFDRTYNDPYCYKSLPLEKHYSVECACAMIPGTVGDATRKSMNELADSYDTALKGLINAWNNENDPNFGVLWQPGSNVISIRNGPITALSPADCFHPSEFGHQGMAAGIWNRITLDQDLKATETLWEDDVWVRCAEEGDRITLPKNL